MIQKPTRMLLLISITVAIAGCQNDDRRVAEVASAAAERQAKQSQQMAESSADLTAGARQLVESAGRSQESLIDIQRRLESQQAEIGRQRDELEKEREAIADRRRAEPVIAMALAQAGLIVACLLPLIICWLVLRAEVNGNANELAVDVLIEEMVVEQPRILAAPQADTGVTGHLPPST
jgi:hypothetical protein